MRVRLDDGTVAVADLINWEKDPSDEYIEDELGRMSFPDGKSVRSWRRVEREDIPEARDFREAWVDSGESIEHDMPKVRAIHMQRIREARNARFPALDAEYMRALGTGDAYSAATIEAKRQELRDLPAEVEKHVQAARTVDEVRAINPRV